MKPQRDWLAITPTEYHALDALSSGGMRCFAKYGPLKYYAQYVARPPIEDRIETSALRVGSALHLCNERPNEWMQSYLLVPQSIEDEELLEEAMSILSPTSQAKRPKLGDTLNLRQSVDAEYFRLIKLKAEQEGKQILTARELLVVQHMRQAILDNHDARELLESSTFVEAACIDVDEPTGLRRKALVDVGTATWFADVKTSLACNKEEFWREFRLHSYDYQFAWYKDVTGIQECYCIYVSKPPENRDPNRWAYEANVIEIHQEITNPPDGIGKWGRNPHADNRRHMGYIAQFMLQAREPGDKDHQGIPAIWHNDGWGAVIDSRELAGLAFAREESAW